MRIHVWICIDFKDTARLESLGVLDILQLQTVMSWLGHILDFYEFLDIL